MNEQGLTGFLLYASVAIGLARRNRHWLFRKPTDWNAVREQLGYEARPDAPPPKPLPEPQRRWLLGFWPCSVDWDAERRRLGYGRTIDAYTVRDPVPGGAIMPLLYRILRRLAVVALIIGVTLIYLVMGKDAFGSPAMFLAITALGALPAAVLAAIAWVVRPPLDDASLRRLWRE